jgi:beta-ureidopropionase
MQRFIAAGVQIAVSPNDVQKNIAKAALWLERAIHEHHANLIVFPETMTTGFTPNLPVAQLYELVDHIPGETTAQISELARKHGVHVVWPTYERGPQAPIVYNSAALIGPDGAVIGIYRKTHPFPTERLAAGGWTTPGTTAEVYETALGTLGIIICYDGDFPELARLLAIKGAEVIVRPSALLRSYDIWYITNCARAYDNHVYLVGVNAVGSDAGQNYYFGNSMIIDPTAWKLAQARGTEEIVSAELDPQPLRYMSHGTCSPQIFDHLEDRNLALYEQILHEARSRFEPMRRVPYQRAE